eukprot:GFUD01024412.1.p1 GENE.GFUD01024412.1~~GFUD01024412.1.p1  ORF type:complete len:1026 (+),score=376.63 GFUD01024412.1:135-3212(+)
MNFNQRHRQQSLNSNLKADVQEFVPRNSSMPQTNNESGNTRPEQHQTTKYPHPYKSDRIDIQMPERPDSSLSRDQFYSLFPAKKKKGKKKSPDKIMIDVNVNSTAENQPSFKILPRNSVTTSQTALDTSSMKWPDIEEDTRAVLQNNKGGEVLPKARSFADMVKKPPPAKKEEVVTCDENNLKPTTSNDGNKKIKKDMYNNHKKMEDRLKLSKNNTAINSILMKKNNHEKVVVNQISASTFGRIGKSDDESKYVMSKVNADLEEKNKTSVVRHELEVEFREPDFHFSSDDDFEVEFSANAAPRPGKNVVNKISAMTFQQIGKTSDNEKYVMKPKSWSSVVGKGLKSADHNSNSLKSDVSEAQSKHKGEPTIHDKIRAKMKDKEELTPEEREILRQKRRERRKKEKENKKKDKEESQRKEMLKPQTSKLRFISSDILNQVNKPSIANKDHILKDKGIKFMDEEYPDLGFGKKPNVVFKKEKVISSEIRDENGKLTSDRESNSEWETEDECKYIKDEIENENNEEVKIEVITNSGPISYSSILRSQKKPEPVKAIPVKTEKKAEEPEKKKVKKKDPIALDLFSALQVKKQQPKKNATVLAGKLKKDPLVKTVRNQLDSSAPSKKRGKEREGGKKKKKTLMKKIILADREKRKLAREEAEKRREDRIKAGISLKPLPRKDDDFDKLVNDVGKEADKNESDEISIKAEEDITQELVQNFSSVSISFSNEEEMKENLPVKKTVEPVKEEDTKEALSMEKQTLEAVIPKTPIEMTTEEKALTAIHSRKFRSYCTHILSAELDSSISLLMTDLVRFQDKQHAKDPVKAKARRRYVVGLREVAKFIKVKKVCCVILAPDIERVETEGGLDDAVTRLVLDAKSQEVGTVFGLNRRKLGKLCLKKVPVSCIGIMNFQGSDENYKTMQSLAVGLTEDYQTKLAAEIQQITSPSLPPARPQSSSSVLSTKAAEFVPSVGFVGDEGGYYDYYGNYCDYNSSYYDSNFYNSNYYNTSQEYTSHSQNSQPWQNMIDILRK